MVGSEFVGIVLERGICLLKLGDFLLAGGSLFFEV